MKYLVCILFVGLFSLNSFAQDSNLPKNAEPGKCYLRCTIEDGSLSDWQTVDCELSKISRDKAKLKALQVKLHNLAYTIDVTGDLDLKTIAAYNQYIKDEKKRIRKARKKRKKEN